MAYPVQQRGKYDVDPSAALTAIYEVAKRWCAHELAEKEFGAAVLAVLERAGLPVIEDCDLAANDDGE